MSRGDESACEACQKGRLACDKGRAAQGRRDGRHWQRLTMIVGAPSRALQKDAISGHALLPVLVFSRIRGDAWIGLGPSPGPSCGTSSVALGVTCPSLFWPGVSFSSPSTSRGSRPHWWPGIDRASSVCSVWRDFCISIFALRQPPRTSVLQESCRPDQPIVTLCSLISARILPGSSAWRTKSKPVRRKKPLPQLFAVGRPR